ncbi:MAG: septum formation initiator family protein [Cellvibrionaceae bacterium]|nr:septum formation initiator family protein [Cellvibrionaceae bacterium]
MDLKKLLFVVLILLLVSLQARLWGGDGSIAHVVNLKREIAKQSEQNQALRAHNSRLAAEVKALKTDQSAMEARARQSMGLIKEGETFFMVIDESAQDAPDETGDAVLK